MNNLPDITVFNSNSNPVIYSPNSPFILPLNQSADTLQDVEIYKNFLKNSEANFRHSRTYKKIKSELINLGMDRCQLHGNITNEMATIEMHHTILTLFDVALIITEHTIKTTGQINTFQLIKKLKEEHKACNVPIVMLSKTPHQLYHNTNELYIPPNMVFGNWVNLLQKYPYGITLEIAYKIINYLTLAVEQEDVEKNDILAIREHVLSWSEYNK